MPWTDCEKPSIDGETLLPLKCRLPVYTNPAENSKTTQQPVRLDRVATQSLSRARHRVMASTAIKSPLPGDSQDPSEVRAKAALDERDEKSIIRLLKDAGVTSYEPRVLSHLVDRMRRYTLEVVQDARDYADHAGRTDIGMEDVRLAVRKKQDALAAGPPTREDIIRQADEVNRIPLPPIPDKFGVRLPPLQYQTTLPNLQWDAEAEVLPDQDANMMDVDPDSNQAQHGNRNKRAKTTPKLETKKPLTMSEKKEQEELNRVKAEARAEAKAKRRMHALHSKRSS